MSSQKLEKATGRSSPSPKGPLASVISVSHNGRRFLPGLLSSLERQSYPNTEIILVDNASGDGTAQFVRGRYPDVRLLRSEENLGFCGGNNLGIRAARGEFIALVNNDTVTDENWLSHLVAEAKASPEVGAVASKILFLLPFVPVVLTVETFNPAAQGLSADSRDLGVLFDTASAFLGCDYKKPILKDGFHGVESRGERLVHWTSGRAEVLLPVPDSAGAKTLDLVVSGGFDSPRRLAVHVGSEAVASFDLSGDFESHRIKVPAEVIGRESCEVLNNAGSRLSERGVAGDRGIYEFDRGQYDAAEDIEAICGASVLFPRRALEQVGIFDPNFFMYYEDTDLSWRLKRHGYRLRYQPQSVVRHIHAASSVAWSPMFNFYVARNKVLMIAKNGSLLDFLRAYATELRATLRLLRWRLEPINTRPEGTAQQLATRLKVQRSLLKQIPLALGKRWRLADR